MGKEPTDKSGAMTSKEKAAEQRAERLRKQLRENLHRRKEQSRARKSDDAEQKS